MTRPRLLDLFCGAGGASVGYQRAGWDVEGVDNTPHPDYPFRLIVADAMAVLRGRAGIDLNDYDAVTASPPCQAYVGLAGDGHPDFVPEVIERLTRWGGLWVVENVVGAPMTGVQLCGSEFGLKVRRHRKFASNVWLMGAGGCRHAEQGTIRAYYGKPGLIAWKPPGWDNVQKKGRPPLYRGTVGQAPTDMGIDWMTWDDLREAIPPAYTEFVGAQLLEHLTRLRAAS